MGTNKSALATAFAVFSGALLSGAIAQVAAPGSVEVAPLARDAFSTGTINRAEGALPPTLWDDSSPQTLEYLLSLMPARPQAPSHGEAMRRVLLSSGSAPDTAAPSLGGKKLLALARAGFVREAQTIASLSTIGRGDPWTGQAQAIADLLDGDIANACQRNARLNSGRDELFWVKLRVLCYAQSGEGDAADLTLNILREQGGLSEADDAFLLAAATGVAPKAPPPAQTALHLAIARSLDLPVSPDLIASADGAVLTALARDASLNPATRIAAAERAVAMGVFSPAELAAVMTGVDFELVDIANAATALIERPHDALTDALAYQSIGDMNAPEFIRDKAKRVASALNVADSFPRAYALSVLYADEISSLEGVLVAPEEALQFSAARMAVGDSAGAGEWLRAVLGANASVAALPETIGLAMIDQVNLLSIQDPATAARVAREAGISLLSADAPRSATANGHSDPAIVARIVEAAFDAAVENKPGQAALAALAAANGDVAGGGNIESVIVAQGLRAAGLSDLSRRSEFERAWAATFANAAMQLPGAAPAENGLTPRLKPQGGQ